MTFPLQLHQEERGIHTRHWCRYWIFNPLMRQRSLAAVCRGRHAVSTWQLLEPLAGGTASLLQWQLRTGRTHQIRVHAKHAGHPLLGDEAYGGAAGTAVNAIGQGKSHRHVLPPCSTASVAGHFG